MIRVLGFGNTLHGDDGFAAHVLEQLEHQLSVNLADMVQVQFAGTAGINAMALFDDVDTVLVVDVIRCDVAKAPLAWYSVEEVLALDFAANQPGSNSHGQGLGYLFKALGAISDNLPQISCLLCASDMPKSYTLGLSDKLKPQITSAATLVEKRIQSNLDGFPITITDLIPSGFDNRWTGMAQLPKKRFPGKVLIFLTDRQYYLISALCPHQGYDLSDQPLNDKDELICPLHNMTIDVQTPCTKNRKNTYKVHKEGNDFTITGFNE